MTVLEGGTPSLPGRDGVCLCPDGSPVVIARAGGPRQSIRRVGLFRRLDRGSYGLLRRFTPRNDGLWGIGGLRCVFGSEGVSPSVVDLWGDGSTTMVEGGAVEFPSPGGVPEGRGGWGVRAGCIDTRRQKRAIAWRILKVVIARAAGPRQSIRRVGLFRRLERGSYGLLRRFTPRHDGFVGNWRASARWLGAAGSRGCPLSRLFLPQAGERVAEGRERVSFFSARSVARFGHPLPRPLSRERERGGSLMVVVEVGDALVPGG
jgi:hypothetical protein